LDGDDVLFAVQNEGGKGRGRGKVLSEIEILAQAVPHGLFQALFDEKRGQIECSAGVHEIGCDGESKPKAALFLGGSGGRTSGKFGPERGDRGSLQGRGSVLFVGEAGLCRQGCRRQQNELLDALGESGGV